MLARIEKPFSVHRYAFPTHSTVTRERRVGRLIGDLRPWISGALFVRLQFIVGWPWMPLA